MAKVEKDKKRSRSKALNQIAQTGDSGMIYREFGDRDAKDVVDVESASWGGTGYLQSTASRMEWIRAIQRDSSIGATTGDYFKWREGLYKITGANSADQIKV